MCKCESVNVIQSMCCKWCPDLLQNDWFWCWCQAIIYTNAGISLIGSLGTNFSEIWIKIPKFSFKKISSSEWGLFCADLDLLSCIFSRYTSWVWLHILRTGVPFCPFRTDFYLEIVYNKTSGKLRSKTTTYLYLLCILLYCVYLYKEKVSVIE